MKQAARISPTFPELGATFPILLKLPYPISDPFHSPLALFHHPFLFLYMADKAAVGIYPLLLFFSDVLPFDARFFSPSSFEFIPLET